jgi:hypothetical protein
MKRKHKQCQENRWTLKTLPQQVRRNPETFIGARVTIKQRWMNVTVSAEMGTKCWGVLSFKSKGKGLKSMLHSRRLHVASESHYSVSATLAEAWYQLLFPRPQTFQIGSLFGLDVKGEVHRLGNQMD